MTGKEYRLMQLSHYRGFVFRWQPWRKLTPDWDHDHCCGCQARFTERAEAWPDKIHPEGWVTLWPTGSPDSEPKEAPVETGYRIVPSPKLHGFQLDWLCPSCFDSCREELGFIVDPDHPQWQAAGL